MELLGWNNRYSVAIEVVDKEHKELIDAVNRLHARLFLESSDATVPGFFGDLLKELSAHFAMEEDLMRERADSRLAEHKGEHERLLDEIREIKDIFEYAEEVDSVDVAMRLDSWFSYHFRTYDAWLYEEHGAHSH